MRLARLWRYPVKSMLGESRDSLELNSRGVAGDRLHAVRDSEGKLGSGKDTRRFRHIEGLFPRDRWLTLFEDVGFEATTHASNHSETDYVATIFVGRRPE